MDCANSSATTLQLFTPILAFGGTILGAFLGSIVNEMYKRHRDATATAAAIAGEMEIMSLTCTQYLTVLPQISEAAKTNGHPSTHWGSNPQTALSVHAEKLGMLGSNVVSLVTRFYIELQGFRNNCDQASSEASFSDRARMAMYFEAAGSYAQMAVETSSELLPLLTKLSRTSFKYYLWRSIKGFFPRVTWGE